MPDLQPEVPEAIEEFLIGLVARAGQIGGRAGGGTAGARGGERGAARGARRQKTTVEQRTGDAPGTSDQVVARLVAAFPAATRLQASDHVRFAVPVGVTGLQQIVVDIVLGQPEVGSGGSRVHVQLCGYGKEGLINRKPTRTITDRAWTAVLSDG